MKKTKNDIEHCSNVDPRSRVVRSIKHFSITADHREVILNIVENGFPLNCDTITSHHFWRDDWNECPLCGAEANDGIIVHRSIQ